MARGDVLSTLPRLHIGQRLRHFRQSLYDAAASVVSATVGGVLVIESVRVVGDVVEVVFKGAQSDSRAVVTATVAAAKQSAIVVGQSVKVVAEGTGYLLAAAISPSAACISPMSDICCANTPRAQGQQGQSCASVRN